MAPSRHFNILVIDDDEFLGSSLSDFLVSKGFRVETSINGKEGIRRFEAVQPQLVLLDQKLPDTGGMELCKRILEINPSTKIIFITAYATVTYAVEAMKAGAFNYISKPFELDELLIQIHMAFKSAQLEGKIRAQDYEREKERREQQLVGSSKTMGMLREQIRFAASSETNILITGETGAGKNVVARAIHDLQEERETFLTINCSAIPESLMEAEYFGHEKGVFTGAERRREGIFELADGGTLVLDEIAEIPMHLQSKLLTALEDKQIRRIGSGRPIPVDVRLIATTNRDLHKSIEAKYFRQDLYYRLAVFNIHVPPLREHPGDIPEIANLFVKRFCRKPTRIPGEQMTCMMKYPWPGNVRELRNVVERACLFVQGDEIRPADLLSRERGKGLPIHESSSGGNGVITIEELTRQHIRKALERYSGNKSRTAKALGISLSTLKRKIQRMSLAGDGLMVQNGSHGP